VTALRGRHAFAAVGLLALLVTGCGDDDGGSDDGASTTSSSVPQVLTGDPVIDDVTVELHGEVEMTFRGGSCVVDQDVLTVNAGYKHGFGAPRPQESPWANGTLTLIGPAEEGEHDTGYALVAFRESDDAVLLDEAPRVTLEPGFLSGTFEGARVSGSFSCPEVLTIEEFNDLLAEHSGE
jgi:hypothetical protein